MSRTAHELPRLPSLARRRPESEEAPARVHDGTGHILDILRSSGFLHEFYAEKAADAVAVSGLATGLCLADGRPVLWVRHEATRIEHGDLYAPGLREMGVDASRLILLQSRDVASVLQGGLEGARCPALGAVVIELRGESRHLDLTASRRLLLAAQQSRTSVFLLRSETEPRPSAAGTRWHIRAAPSLPLAARASGRPAFELTLLRRRNGAGGLRFCVEWNRDVRDFEERITTRPAIAGAGDGQGPAAGPALSGIVVPLPFDRQGAGGTPGEPLRQAG